MINYTAPVQTTFELQQKSIEQSSKAFNQFVAYQQKANETLVDGFKYQQSVQARAFNYHQNSIHSALDTVESTVPGTESLIADLRKTVDEQYGAIAENHETLVDTITTECTAGFEAYDNLAATSLEILDDQIQFLLETNEELEGQSVKAVEEFENQVEQLQTHVEEAQSKAIDVADV